MVGIHGPTASSLQLGHYARFLSGLSYQVITLDVRGRGDSSPAEEASSIFNHAQNVKDLIKVMEIEDPILMGYFMGAFIVALIAGDDDFEGRVLILLDGAAEMTDHQRPIVEPSIGDLSKTWPSEEAYLDSVAEGYEGYGIPRTKELEAALSYGIEEKDGYWETKADEDTVRQDWESFWDFDPARVI